MDVNLKSGLKIILNFMNCNNIVYKIFAVCKEPTRFNPRKFRIYLSVKFLSLLVCVCVLGVTT